MGKLSTLATQMEAKGYDVERQFSLGLINLVSYEGYYRKFRISDFDLLNVIVAMMSGPYMDICLNDDLAYKVMETLNKRSGEFTWFLSNGYLQVRMTLPVPARVNEVLSAIAKLEEVMVETEEEINKLSIELEKIVEELVRKLKSS